MLKNSKIYKSVNCCFYNKNSILFKGFFGYHIYIIKRKNEFAFFKRKCKRNYIYLNKLKYSSLFNDILVIIKGLTYGFNLKLEIKGRGFSFFLKDSFLYMYMGYSHCFRLFVSENLYVFNNKKYLSFFFFDFFKFYNIVLLLKSLCPLSKYKEKGLMVKGSKFKIKLGKQDGNLGR